MKNNRKVPRKAITFMFIFYALFIGVFFFFFISNFLRFGNNIPVPFIIMFSLFIIFFITMIIFRFANFFKNKDKMFDRIDKSIRVREKMLDKLDEEIVKDVQEETKQFCSYCGARLNEGEHTCPLCGKKN